MKNINNNNSIIENKSIVENSVKLNSLTKYANRKTLYRLSKVKSGKSKIRYDKYKNSTTLIEAYKNSSDYNDIRYDTTNNDKFKKVNLLLDTSVFLVKEKKNEYLDLLSDNNEFIKFNKVSKEILENIKYFTNKVNSL
jgi:hypothetical protein